MAREVASCQGAVYQVATNVATKIKSKGEALLTPTMSTSYLPSSSNNNINRRKCSILRNRSSRYSSRNNNNNNNNLGDRERYREVPRRQIQAHRLSIKISASVRTQSYVATAARVTSGLTAPKEKLCIRQIRHHRSSWNYRRAIRRINDFPRIPAATEVALARLRLPWKEWMIGSCVKEII